MADREIINVGSTVDDGTGDLLRNAFQKVNNNFTEIWAKTSVNSNLSVSEFSVTSDGDLILAPADEVKIAKAVVINSDKGNYDTTIHGDSIDNIVFVDASAGRVGILNNTPSTTLDVTGNVNVSNTLTTMALNTTGHTVLGDDIADTVTFNARVNSSFQPYGNQTLGLLTNRWQNAYLQNLDVSGVISGTLTGGLDPTIVISNDINNTTIETTALDVNGSTELDDVLVTGNLVVQGTTTTLETTEVLVNNSIVFEGATADDYETTITVADPTQDNTITFQDASGTLALTSDIPTVPTAVSSFTNDSGYITDYTVTESDVTAHQAAISITESQISDLGSYLEPVSTPTASTGQVGDDAGLVAFDSNYIYYCTASYDGSTHIWKRTAWSGDTWPV